MYRRSAPTCFSDSDKILISFLPILHCIKDLKGGGKTKPDIISKQVSNRAVVLDSNVSIK